MQDLELYHELCFPWGDGSWNVTILILSDLYINVWLEWKEKEQEYLLE